MDSCRPSIDSGLSISRIGSNAQCKIIKILSVGLKNELTNYRIMDLSSNRLTLNKSITLNQMFFQDHLSISSINLICILIMLYRNGIIFNNKIIILKLTYLLSCLYLYLYYIMFIIKSSYSMLVYFYLFNFYLLILSFNYWYYSLFINSTCSSSNSSSKYNG